MQRLLTSSSPPAPSTYKYSNLCSSSLFSLLFQPICGAAWCMPSVVAYIMDNFNTSIVPYHDPFDDNILTGLSLSLFDDENPTIDDDNNYQGPIYENYPTIVQGPIYENTTNLNSDGLRVPDYDSYSDSFLLEISFESGNRFVGNSTNSEGEVPGKNNCQILREITHGNGTILSKLGIFGTIGRISHASLEKSTMDNHVSTDTIDIRKVKQFLIQYFEGCKKDGYIVIEDTLSEFYQTLSVHSGDRTNDINNLLQLSPTTSQQRRRTKLMNVKDFEDYLHLSIQEAGIKLNVCPTVMKRVCRRDGLRRWPSRKINSIKRKISKRQESLSSIHAGERKSAKADITKLEKELADIFETIQ
uniref:RWP-RK domain containing protein n=1 Tax=Solanum tuberosum TaxID=4113 RepID=M1BYU1_SOLTU